MTSILFHNDTSTINHLWFESHKRLLTSLCIKFDKVEQIEPLLAEFLGVQMKMPKLKDPNKPKRAGTAYLFYCNSKRPALMDAMKKKGLKINVGQLQQKLGKSWKALSEPAKKSYIAMAEKDSIRYKEEMEEFNSKS
jgi:hypothetical protein|tara:strand:+ start:224 stop:634 length:411 start_codon:yes stop_codon:yes gene_type:complete